MFGRAPAGPDAIPGLRVGQQAKTSARPRLRPTHFYTPLLPAHNNLLPPTYFSLQSLSETGTSCILCKQTETLRHYSFPSQISHFLSKCKNVMDFVVANIRILGARSLNAASHHNPVHATTLYLSLDLFEGLALTESLM